MAQPNGKKPNPSEEAVVRCAKGLISGKLELLKGQEGSSNSGVKYRGTAVIRTFCGSYSLIPSQITFLLG